MLNYLQYCTTVCFAAKTFTQRSVYILLYCYYFDAFRQLNHEVALAYHEHLIVN